jgi:WD40 repeat protein
MLIRRQLHEGAVTALAWHPGAHRLAIAGEDGAIEILDLDTSGTTTVTRSGGRGVELLAWNPAGTVLAIARGHAVAISAGDGRPISYLPAVESTIAGLSWSPDGALIACACYGGVRLFDPKTRRGVRRLDAAGSMLSLAWSPDGSVIACGCQDNRVCTWRLPNGEDTSMSGYASKPKALSFSGDGRLLATAGGHDASVWNLGGDGADSRTPLRLVGHSSPITTLAFAPERALLATACREGHLHLWEPSEHGRPVAFLRMEHRVENLAWGAGGGDRDMLLAATDAGGALAVWAVAP